MASSAPQPALDPVDIEALAAQEHESWSGWTRWMLGEIEKELKVYPGPIRSYDLSELACIRRWQRQVDTPYSDLSEKEKESDRKVVREKLGLYRSPEHRSKFPLPSRLAGLKNDAYDLVHDLQKAGGYWVYASDFVRMALDHLRHARNMANAAEVIATQRAQLDSKDPQA